MHYYYSESVKFPRADTELKKVLVLYTGGTIGMKKNRRQVYEPVPDIFESKVKSCPELHDLELAKKYSVRDFELITSKAIIYQIREHMPPLDSCNMSVKEWVTIAKNIEENYNGFDGFVVLCGTDTLTYISSVLSFMFKNLGKPIIVTGSQISIFENPTDAKNHFLMSLVFASCAEIPEVCVYFNNKLMRGNRVQRVHTNRMDAFESPNYPLLAECELHIRLNRNFIMQKNEKQITQAYTNLNPHVGILYMFPTLTRTQLLSFFEPNLEGLVWVTYGSGNIPSHRQDILDLLRNAVRRGVTVVNVTQCVKGAVNTSYETGECMEELGIIPLHDITVEAAYTKLMVVCGIEKRSEERGEIMKKCISGEMTVGPSDEV